MRPFTADTPALAAPEPGRRSLARRLADFGPRRGSTTRRTPRSVAACSLIAELKPRSPAAAAEERAVPIQCRLPQRHIRGTSRVHLVGGDDGAGERTLLVAERLAPE